MRTKQKIGTKVSSGVKYFRCNFLRDFLPNASRVTSPRIRFPLASRYYARGRLEFHDLSSQIDRAKLAGRILRSEETHGGLRDGVRTRLRAGALAFRISAVDCGNGRDGNVRLRASDERECSCDCEINAGVSRKSINRDRRTASECASPSPPPLAPYPRRRRAGNSTLLRVDGLPASGPWTKGSLCSGILAHPPVLPLASSAPNTDAELFDVSTAPRGLGREEKESASARMHATLEREDYSSRIC